jgi:glycosyltransferase involved in cell wall biosynthesis
VLNNKKIVVVLPAYNAFKTLERSFREIPLEIVDDVILVDDCSTDQTPELARKLGIDCIVHETNLGYGGNQKTCYREALKRGADIVVMLHPDYQYTPKLIPALVSMIAYGEYDAAIASRILGKGALIGGMPLYKYFFNRVLTLIQNILMGQKFSEYHTGFRAFSRQVLENLPLEKNSNDFIFDNQMIAQMVFQNFKVAEISCPTRYFPEASSINLRRSVVYGLGVIKVSLQYFFKKRWSGFNCRYLHFSS